MCTHFTDTEICFATTNCPIILDYERISRTDNNVGNHDNSDEYVAYVHLIFNSIFFSIKYGYRNLYRYSWSIGMSIYTWFTHRDGKLLVQWNETLYTLLCTSIHLINGRNLWEIFHNLTNHAHRLSTKAITFIQGTGHPSSTPYVQLFLSCLCMDSVSINH